MTNLDSILKSRDITLPAKVCIVKAMVFPVVMYGWCESWTKRKLSTEELMLLNCGVEKILESPLDSKAIQPVHPKGDQLWIFIGRTDAEAETPIHCHVMWRTDSFEKTFMLGKIEGEKRGDHRGWDGWMALFGSPYSVDMSKVWELVTDSEAWRDAVHGMAKSQTWLSDWARLNPSTQLFQIPGRQFYNIF